MLKKVTAIALLILVLPSLIAGCGEGKKIPALAEISGTVVADGKPLKMVQVVFMPEPREGEILDAPQPSRAVTDEDGKFVLKYGGDPYLFGAAIGPHRITMDDTLHHESRENPVDFRFSQRLVGATTTPLRFEVKEGGDNSVTLDITEHMVN
ncbi:MAG: hypothetical protein MK106_14340 [Mariniblastus sp.]|nr:hypothetical protein [Mariniblastus sp.]